MRIGLAVLTAAAALMLVGVACGPQPASGAGSTQPTATPTPTFPSGQPTAAPTPTFPSSQPTAAPTPTTPSAQSTAVPTPTAPPTQPTATPTLAAPSAQPTATPAQTARPDGQARVRVPVKSVDIQSVSIVVSGGAAEIVLEHGLPDGCHEFGGYGVDESSMPRIVVEVFNTRPAATGVVACAEIYLIEETRIPLEADVEPCGTYVVEINGEGRRVQAMEPGKQCDAAQDAKPTPVSPSPTAEPGFTRVQVPAYVESASIVVSGGSAELVIVTGQPSACYEFGGYELDESSMPRIVLEVFNTKYTNVACAQVYSSTETRVPLEQTIEPCKEYTVKINGGERRMQATEPGKRCSSARAVKPGLTPQASTAEPPASKFSA